MEDKTLKELLPEFYKEYHLGDEGGNHKSYVRVEVTKKIILYIPNFKARKKAVLKHDIHHLVTGYSSTFKGKVKLEHGRSAPAVGIIGLHGFLMRQDL